MLRRSKRLVVCAEVMVAGTAAAPEARLVAAQESEAVWRALEELPERRPRTTTWPNTRPTKLGSPQRSRLRNRLSTRPSSNVAASQECVDRCHYLIPREEFNRPNARTHAGPNIAEFLGVGRTREDSGTLVSYVPSQAVEQRFSGTTSGARSGE